MICEIIINILGTNNMAAMDFSFCYKSLPLIEKKN